jgi:membrane-bound lytic murein transglycosylase B
MTLRLLAGVTLCFLSVSSALAIDLDQPEVEAFITTMVEEHDFDREQLRDTLGAAEVKQSILDAIARPAEKTKSWAEYREIFITPERIEAGAQFWVDNEDALRQVSEATGVPMEMLAGSFRVLDALSTLAFSYPPRAKFFRRELEQYLLLVREEGMQATDATGSYAGAMGRPQFMPSSFRAYAVDATGDGKRDIWNDWTDVAGSIANYFLEHGWKPGEDVAAQASLGGSWQGPVPEPRNTLKPSETVASLSRKGVMFVTDLPGDSKGELLTYEGADGLEHWVGFHNFFVITRYNRNVMYALAVHQLGQEIALEVSRNAS